MSDISYRINELESQAKDLEYELNEFLKNDPAEKERVDKYLNIGNPVKSSTSWFYEKWQSGKKAANPDGLKEIHSPLTWRSWTMKKVEDTTQDRQFFPEDDGHGLDSIDNKFKHPINTPVEFHNAFFDSSLVPEITPRMGVDFGNGEDYTAFTFVPKDEKGLMNLTHQLMPDLPMKEYREIAAQIEENTLNLLKMMKNKHAKLNGKKPYSQTCSHCGIDFVSHIKEPVCPVCGGKL